MKTSFWKHRSTQSLFLGICARNKELGGQLPLLINVAISHFEALNISESKFQWHDVHSDSTMHCFFLTK